MRPLPPETPNVLVVAASVIAPVVADEARDGPSFRQRLRGEVLAGPDLLRVEVLSVIRRQTAAGSLTSRQANAALEDLLELPVAVFPTEPLLRRAWELRDNVTAYDACYLALAEALDCLLVTADTRLANAPGARCSIEVLKAARGGRPDVGDHPARR